MAMGPVSVQLWTLSVLSYDGGGSCYADMGSCYDGCGSCYADMLCYDGCGSCYAHASTPAHAIAHL